MNGSEGNGVWGWMGAFIGACCLVGVFIGALFSNLLAIFMLSILVATLVAVLTYFIHECFKHKDY